ncbi:MAG: hypothetical protein R6X32_03685 [Chloroflexota bacterium]
MNSNELFLPDDERAEARSAQAGDYYLLLVPEDTAVTLTWQRPLQQRFGGQCTDPVHVSLQRFVCENEARIQQLADALETTLLPYPPIPIIGRSLFSLYSDFRQENILKCEVERPAELVRITQTINQMLVRLKIETTFATASTWITVLDGIDKTTEDQILFPQPLFMATRLLCSQIVGTGRYRVVWQLDFE